MRLRDETPAERLDRLRDDYREWNAFPCNTKGNDPQADEVRVWFEQEIARLRTLLR